MIKNLQAIILAAGKSTRFNTKTTKLAEPICGQAMILYATKLLEKFSIPTTTVLGHCKELIQEILIKNHPSSINTVVQTEQKGTGHALLVSQNHWTKDHILVLNADVPLITETLITKLYNEHIATNAAVSFVTACSPESTNKAYGRIVRTGNDIEIVEAKDFTGNIADSCCINAGIYIIKKTFLTNYIHQLTTNNANKELYITDLIKMASITHSGVTVVNTSFDEIRGINTFQELWEIEQIKRSELIKHWMDQGVRFAAAQNVHIDLNVTIGAGSYIGCGVQLTGNTIIGEDCTIQEFSSLNNARLENNVSIKSHTVIKNAHIKSGSCIGPFAHVHDNVTIKENSIIGNFVEVKNSTIGSNTKAKHLSYIGDATLGSHVNIGAGTITCNYDGTNKHRTIIKDNVFVGSNNTLVAPLTLEKNSFTAAGSTITDNVPNNALAIARSRQTNKLDYADKLRTPKNIDLNDTTNDTQNNPTDTFSFIAARVLHNDIPSKE